MTGLQMKISTYRTECHSLFIMLLLGLLPAKSFAGVMVGGTRFIYEEKNENGVSFLVKNTDASPYLIQTKVLVDNSDGNTQKQSGENIPFVATPPLLPLRGKKETYIRLIRTEGILPSDRESLFQVSMAFIPSGAPSGNEVQVALRSRYKLIYRPSGLKGQANKAYQQLRWQRHGASVTVENPGPYYVTLFQVGINGKYLPAVGVVAPFASRTASWCPKNGNCNLQWQSLDDGGDPTPAWVITPIGIADIGKAISNANPVVTPKIPDEKKLDEKNSEAHANSTLP